jgi:hypothetical protein
MNEKYFNIFYESKYVGKLLLNNNSKINEIYEYLSSMNKNERMYERIDKAIDKALKKSDWVTKQASREQNGMLRYWLLEYIVKAVIIDEIDDQEENW